jgi:cell wall-associated NlpC family hydrolase
MIYNQSNGGAAALAFAETLAGKPYVYGGDWPESGGTDCSGLAMWAYAQVGITLPRTTYSQYLVSQIPLSEPQQQGDLLFFEGTDPGPNGEPGHVGLYSSPGVIFNAPYTDDPGGIRFDDYPSPVLYATRPALLLPHAPPPPVHPPKEPEMLICATPTGKGFHVVSPTGEVTVKGDAAPIVNNKIPVTSPATITGVTGCPLGGFWAVDSVGNVYGFGKAKGLVEGVG